MAYITLIATVLGFFCSLAYNYGYFWSYDAGMSLLSITDILRSYSLWIPGIFGFILLGYYMEAVSTRIEQGKTEVELAQGTRNPELTIKIRNFFNKKLPFFCVLGLCLYYVFIGHPYKPIIFGLACLFIWSIFISFILSHAKTEGLKRLMLEIFLLLPIFIISSFFWGLHDSQINEAKSKPNAIFYLSDYPEIKHPTILIRNLESGLLVKENELYELYSWNIIYKISPIKQKDYRGILCDSINICIAQSSNSK